MTFLTTSGVDLGLRFFEHIFPLASASDDCQIVNGVALGSFVISEILGVSTCTVHDTGIDSLAGVFVSIFEKRDADKHMGWDVLVQPVPNLADELAPVSVVSLENLENWGSSIVRTTCIPHELVMGRTNVLGSLDEANHIIAFLESICVLVDKIVPVMLLREVIKFQIVEGNLVLSNWSVAVEYGQDVVTLFDFSLIHGE